MNRREFLTSAAGAGFVSLAGSSFVGAKNVKRIGLQLYTIRDAMKKDFEGSLARVAQIGYKEVEFAGYFERTPQQVSQLLKQHRLSSPSAHLALKVLTDDLPGQVETAKTIGQKFLVCPALPDEIRKTADDWKKIAATFNKIGADCRKAGLTFVYHNHDFEFRPVDGQVPYDLLLTNTDPELVRLEMDLYWVVKANHDPVTYFEKHPGRFPLVHVKDMDKTSERGFAEVGRGSMDFKRIFQASGKAGVKHFIVEQDQTPGDPFDSIEISYDYLETFNF